MQWTMGLIYRGAAAVGWLMGLFTVLTLLIVSLDGVRGWPTDMSTLTREADTPHDRCTLPTAWTGEWFLSGVIGTITIQANAISGKGACVREKSDKFVHKFLLHNRIQNCSQCIITSSPQQHNNVIQFKESYCVPAEEQYTFEELCDTITGNADLFTMFRLNAEPERCPFGGRYSFTYTQGFIECSNPVSQTEMCVRESEMMLHYKSCPDATEERNVKLECLGSWRKDENRFLIGRITHNMANSNEETFRCFIYKITDSGVQLAQSADATCNALYSPQEGPQTLTLTPENDPEPNCIFPLWLTQRSTWHSMESDLQFSFAGSGTSLRQFSGNGTEDEEVILETTCMMDFPARITVGESFKAVMFATRGCTSGYICMQFVKLNDQIVQLHQGRLAKTMDLACSKPYFSVNRTEWVTLIPASAQGVACPFPGEYLVGTIALGSTERKCRQGTKISIGCGRDSVIRFQPTSESNGQCPDALVDEINLMEFVCHGHWKENEISFFIASDKKNYSARYCFMYQTQAGAVRISSIPQRCPNLIDPQNDLFNVTKFTECTSSVANSVFSVQCATIWLLVGLAFNGILRR